MSRRPLFRLTLAYPVLTITASRDAMDGCAGHTRDGSAGDRDAAPTEIDLSKTGYERQLRALSIAIRRARGRLRVVLPESEVWRGLVPGVESDRVEAARARAAVALGCDPRALVLIAGDVMATGETPFAAVSRKTLGEARGFLRRHGLRPAAFVGAGVFDGFAAPPLFPAGVTPGLPGVAALARGARTLRPALPAAADLLPGWPPSGAVVAGGGLGLTCAAVALIAALAPAPEAPGRMAQVTSPVPVAPVVARLAAPAAQVSTPAPNPPAAVAEAGTAVPRVHVERRPRRAERDLRIAMSLPAPPRPAAMGGRAAPQPIVAIATRNMPELDGARLNRPMPGPRVAQLVEDVASRSDIGPSDMARPPMPRPSTGSGHANAITGVAGAFLDEDGAIRRPEPRARAAAVGAQLADPSRPKPRGGADPARPLSPAITAAVGAAAVQVASLSPTGEAGRPEPRPGQRRSVAPASASAVATRATPVNHVPVGVTPARTIPAETTPARAMPAEPIPVRAVAPQPVRATPQGSLQRQASREPARVAAPATQQRRLFGSAGARRAAESTGVNRGGLSLLGVFGAKTSRYALIRLPDGAVQRVRPGDPVAGARVAAVGGDSVRLTGSGRDLILRIE